VANFSVRYGASIRKRYWAVRADKSAHYKCEMCGRNSVKRTGTSVWRCRHCGTIYAGGAYTMTTAAGVVARRLIQDYAKKQ